MNATVKLSPAVAEVLGVISSNLLTPDEQPIDNSDIFGQIFDIFCVQRILLDYVSPEQVAEAQTFEQRCKLLSAFLRGIRGEDGFAVETKCMVLESNPAA